MTALIAVRLAMFLRSPLRALLGFELPLLRPHTGVEVASRARLHR